MVAAGEEKARKFEMMANIQGQKIGIKAKARARGNAKVELAVEIREDHVAFLVVEIIYYGSARNGRNFVIL